MSILSKIKDRITGKTPKGHARSSAWPAVRKSYLARKPSCEACGGTRALEVHHVVPFHIDPRLELLASNLITLCEAGPAHLNCHLLVGHLGDWKLSNPTVRRDAAYFRQRLFEARQVSPGH